ncbi:MAG: nitrilase-related carbon-nitrogen hydrolase [Gammaproteobacteria bacterium]|jgi:predicted amidohydrolase|nr:nitrilase-related carbon-nitrogen hydrolase [Gammaproteobacteria bacterium]MDP6616505.1 nitrilase-related carbon-nitrogen hydrolase [Gammaproteobacteria bacterium]MDP6694246.1 nitrilase-related carbon-nitrogen hydrolase [Gammaproteobacteria bacterium]
MIEPYNAVALQTKVETVHTRAECEKNLQHIGNMIDLVTHICSLELPVRLICIGEGAIQGFIDEIANMSPPEYAETMAAELPGWETEFLGEKAKEKGCFIMGQLKVKLPEFPDRFFNAIFIIDPNGEIVYTHYKNIVLFVEHSTTPHDVYDEWVKLHGDGLDAFFPVAETEIGNIAGSVGVEGAFPESFRAFALNGAEIFYRSALPEPWVTRGIYETQNRARAMDNTAYMVAPNTGALIVPGENGPTVVDGALGGRSSIVDYKGHVLAHNDIVGDTYVTAEINIEALRHYRETAKFQNWIPYIRSEIFSHMYDEPIWPKNLPNMKHEDAAVVFKETVERLQKRGTYKKKL